MSRKVVVDADLWEWLVDSAHHDDGCSGVWPEYRCRCGFRDIEPKLDGAAVPVEQGSAFESFTAGDGHRSIRGRTDGWYPVKVTR